MNRNLISWLLAGTLLLTGCSVPIKSEIVEDDKAIASETVEKNGAEQVLIAKENIEEPVEVNIETEIETNPTLINSELIKERLIIDVQYSPTSVEAKVPAYDVNSDLSNIENLDQFQNFTEKQKALLVNNKFFVQPTEQEQLFYIYEDNEYKLVPSFVTTDSVLQVYHIFYDYSLRTLENEKLIFILEDLNESLLHKMIALYNQVEDEALKTAIVKNMAVLGTATLTLEKELPENMPETAMVLARKEFDLIKSENGFIESPIFGFELDYSQYRPRGHYTRTDDLKRYFRTMMWYGQVPMPLYKEDEHNNIVRDIDNTLQAIILAHSVFMEAEEGNDVEKWENIYDPTHFYVGATDDLDIYAYETILRDIYGDEIDLNTLNTTDKLDAFYKAADLLPEPKIQPAYTSLSTPVGKQFRLMGQRFVPDAEIIQGLVEPITRPIPKGLDVMAVLGSERAKDILLNKYKEQDNWEQYPTKLEKLTNKYKTLDQSIWQSNMYYGWMWTLKGYMGTYGEGYPSFMTHEAWQDKSLSSALGSWSELKHDTVLYGKQSGAECGGGEEPPEIRGYVEPNLEVYEKLLWLNRFSKENLKQRGLITGQVESKLEQFDELLTFLIDCSIKELNNEALSPEENYQLLTYGGMLEFLTASFAGEGTRWFEITSDTDRNMAVIADIYTVAPNPVSDGGYFEVGVGPAHEIYVVVPIEGKLYLTRGAVFSYYEFVNGEKRLTDEDWQKMIKENDIPEQQEWIKEYQGNPTDMEVPEPTQPYSSGC